MWIVLPICYPEGESRVEEEVGCFEGEEEGDETNMIYVGCDGM